MKTLLTALALVASAALVPHAQANQSEPRSIAGRWTITTSADGPHGAATLPLTLVQDGRKVTATLTPPHGDELSLAGEFVSNELTLATTPPDDKHHVVKLQARLKEDGTLAGFVSTPGGDVTFTAARVRR
jgi:hypothetical protein